MTATIYHFPPRQHYTRLPDHEVVPEWPQGSHDIPKPNEWLIRAILLGAAMFIGLFWIAASAAVWKIAPLLSHALSH